MRRLLVALSFLTGLVGPVALMAQAPPPVPALPDSERRTSYTITGSNCNCPIGFNLYGDATDFGAWIEVYKDGVLQDPSSYGVSSPSGSLATLPRPITDAILTFHALTTGEIQIVGGRRPRRTQLFSENRGVAARDLNQIFNDVEAQNRETWDLRNRSIIAQPGNIMGPLPSPVDCAGAFLTFDSTGLQPNCTQIQTGSILTLPNNFVTNSQLQNMPARTVKCNPTGGSASPQDCVSDAVTPLISTFSNDLSGTVPPVGHTTALSQVFLRGDGAWVSSFTPSPPILTLFTSGKEGTFTPSVGTLYLGIEMCGGGGGGGGSTTGAIAAAGSPGSVTFFGQDANGHYYTAAFGASPGTVGLAGTQGFGGRGGATSGGDVNLRGASGDHQLSAGPGAGTGSNDGGNGAASAFGGGGNGGMAGSAVTETVSGTAAESFCAGGGGGSGAVNMFAGGGGGAGGYLEKIIQQPISTDYLYRVGDGGSGGVKGTGGGSSAGASGANGVLMIMMFFQ